MSIVEKLLDVKNNEMWTVSPEEKNL